MLPAIAWKLNKSQLNCQVGLPSGNPCRKPAIGQGTHEWTAACCELHFEAMRQNGFMPARFDDGIPQTEGKGDA